MAARAAPSFADLVQVQFVGLTIAYPGVLPVSLVLGALLLDLPAPGVRRPVRAPAVLLLAGRL